jgi:hypothetical protein
VAFFGKLKEKLTVTTLTLPGIYKLTPSSPSLHSHFCAFFSLQNILEMDKLSDDELIIIAKEIAKYGM